MPEYLYRGKKGAQKVQEGTIEAQSKNEALAKLDTLGIFPLSLEEKKITARLPKNIGLKELVEFTNQLSTLINSGSPLLPSLQTLTSGAEQTKLRPILEDVINTIKEGSSLSEALKKYPRIFSQFYTSLVKIGETSGTLGQNLRRIAEFLEDELDFKTNLISILTYPLIIVTIGALTVIILLKFVIPKLVSIFEDIGQTLPLPTTILINISNIFSNYWWALIALCLVLFFMGRKHYRQPHNKLRWYKIQLTIPLVGEILKKIEICRLARTLAVLMKNGVPLDSSLHVLETTTPNLFFQKEINAIGERIKEGASLHESMKKSPIFNLGFINVIKVGEESGRLEEVLDTLAHDYNKEISRKMKTFMNILEPLLIFTVGIIVGFVVLSMLLPIFQIDFNIG